jgi:ABC-2 type transport system ATP-binding protein
MSFTPWRSRKTYVARIGAVFGQKSQLIWDIPPMDSFEMNKAIYDIPPAEYRERLKKMTGLLEVEGLVKKPTRQLSLGERMKCEFIMAMLHNPRVVFLDEPTIGLDVIAKERIREFILEMNRKGTTFVLTTHDLSDVESMAGRVMVVNNGEIVYDNTVEALRSFFGNKKLVSLSTHRPMPDLSGTPGIVIRNIESPCNIQLELDTDQMELNRFIQMMNENYIISDMSMGSPLIESVIKELYINTKK